MYVKSSEIYKVSRHTCFHFKIDFLRIFGRLHHRTLPKRQRNIYHLINKIVNTALLLISIFIMVHKVKSKSKKCVYFLCVMSNVYNKIQCPIEASLIV